MGLRVWVNGTAIPMKEPPSHLPWHCGQAGSGRQMEFPPAHFAEALNQFGGILMSKSIGRVTQLREAGNKLGPGFSAVPVFLGSLGEQFFANRLQLRFHLTVVHEVHLLELIDELYEAIERFLMHAGVTRVDASQHLLAELTRLLA